MFAEYHVMYFGPVTFIYPIKSLYLYCIYECKGYRDIDLELHVWIPHGKIADPYFFSELSPLVKLRPFEKQRMKFCKCRISKSIIDRNLKLVSADRGC